MTGEDVFGDSDAWTRHLALAWRAAADPTGSHPLPPRPDDIDGWDQIAWWSPLLHLVAFGTGWPRPDVGLARWHELGRPADDPRLAVAARWWGGWIQLPVDWGARSAYFSSLGARTAEVLAIAPPDATTIADLGIRVQDVPKAASWGGGDPMHLIDHLILATHGGAGDGRLVTGSPPTATRSGRAVLLLDRYYGWYGALNAHGATLPHDRNLRSWKIDVVCRPVGWLGTYRRSRASGRWFAGRHRWHELGIP